MSTYVLIHGGLGGAWCWDKVVPLLEERGHRVVAPDLPGHGRDTTPVSEVTMEAYVNCVCNVLDAQPEPVILVGHSMGGAIITQAAEYRPDRIKTLVYLAAFLPQNGEFTGGIDDTESLLRPNVVMSDDGSYITFRDEILKEACYADCSDEDVARAKSLMCPQATLPNITPVVTTEANFGRVPRVYITTLRDRALSPYVQKQMYTALPCGVISMDTSHSPMFSTPGELVDILVSL